MALSLQPLQMKISPIKFSVILIIYYKKMKDLSVVVTLPSLEPMTSCTLVLHPTTKPKVWTQAQGWHHTPPPFLESLVFSLTRHYRLLPNQSPGQASKPHQPLNPQCCTTLGCHASACVRANTSDTKCCDSAESWTHNLSHTSPASYR